MEPFSDRIILGLIKMKMWIHPSGENPAVIPYEKGPIVMDKSIPGL